MWSYVFVLAYVHLIAALAVGLAQGAFEAAGPFTVSIATEIAQESAPS